jgi:ectoine hydroxylase-related dioxygenase (phytanoyl-CoA dioxygenase family)
VNLGPVFSAAELETIGAEYDRLVTKEAQVLGNPEDGVYPYRAMLNFRSPELKKLITDARLLELAVSVLGPDVRFYWDQGINKSPGAGSEIAWHQDNGYQGGRTQEYLTCWLALDDSSLENGGLLAVPGSHRGGQRNHEWVGVHAVIPESEFEPAEAVPLDARAGDLLIFSSLLIHKTVGNETRDRHRRAWVVQYCRGDQRNEDTGEVYDDRPWVVRGGEMVSEPWAERKLDLRPGRS